MSGIGSERLERGLLRPQLFMGIISSVSASQARVNLSEASAPSGSHFEARRYGRGEVGEFVLIEGQVSLVLGRLIEVRLPELERKGLTPIGDMTVGMDVLGIVQFLGAVRTDTLRVSAGVASYPRLGDRVYAAPHEFVAQIPKLLDGGTASAALLTLQIGSVSGANGAEVSARPEKLFGRHCAVLGATGGGKSWTVARLVEECAKHNAKVILLDATGEYRSLSGKHVIHCHLGDPIAKAAGSAACSLPASNFQESDFIALFEPAGKVQGPKLRDAMRSLRLIKVEATLAKDGLLRKANNKKQPVEAALQKHAAKIEAPETVFDVVHLARQVFEECIWPSAGTSSNPDHTTWGGYADGDKAFCLALVTRITALVASRAFAPVFQSAGPPLAERIGGFLDDKEARVLRICLGGVSYEYRAREFIANTIGRILLQLARSGRFEKHPLLVFVDEAHNFLGRTAGIDDATVRLDAFELIAREGRKFGLNVCLATQRPRDLTESVLSQMGTLIVHRLTNDRDRDIVERACGEIDRAASAFLANLRAGEAAIIGVDFPIPLTVQVSAPEVRPMSDGPNYQEAWKMP
jgi:hypothetical protein